MQSGVRNGREDERRTPAASDSQTTSRASVVQFCLKVMPEEQDQGDQGVLREEG